MYVPSGDASLNSGAGAATCGGSGFDCCCEELPILLPSPDGQAKGDHAQQNQDAEEEGVSPPGAGFAVRLA
jgi:hypothetical protein